MDRLGVVEEETEGAGGESRSEEVDYTTSTHHREENGALRESAVQRAHVQREFAGRETTGVRVWRTILLIMILVTGAAVSTGTYLFLSREQKRDYQKSYDKFANSIRSAVTEFHSEVMLDSLRGLSQTITGHAVSSNSTFPMVTMPMFEVHAAHARRVAGVEIIAYEPIVIGDENRTVYENYSVQNQGWLEESRRVHVIDAERNEYDYTLSLGMQFVEGNVTPYIHDGHGEMTLAGSGPYTPIWQQSPPPFQPSVINYNRLYEAPDMQNALSVVRQAKEAIITEAKSVSMIVGSAVTDQAHEDFHRLFVHLDRDKSAAVHPHSSIVQPVFADVVTADAAGRQQSEIVALLECIIPWDRYFSGLLPDDVSGIVSVLRNTCGQAFTYELDGQMATYLGEGDLHDPAYDSFEEVIPFYNYLYPDLTPTLDGHCEYSFSIYPSWTFKKSYHPSVPIVFTVLVAVVFFLMAAVFFVYDMFVYQRNKKVMGAAARSTAIVAGIFPSNVRDRLLKEANNSSVTASKTSSRGSISSRRRSNEKTGNDGKGGGGGNGDGALSLSSKPIADLFPETTIMFSDIAGFTAWSSMREPTQVFILLETLYRAFDEIARRLRVFKVETIGDCYVAVTGLPEPRPDHALAMARFARDCMHKARQLTKKLEVTLGPDTAELAMRTGLHSGPVTAGVLRGERSRFQLFGDTMNTASRMESNGKPNKIHMSQETADLLSGSGKAHWVRPREEKIVAKGKGELQTYWLEAWKQAPSETAPTESTQSEDTIDNDLVAAPEGEQQGEAAEEAEEEEDDAIIARAVTTDLRRSIHKSEHSRQNNSVHTRSDHTKSNAQEEPAYVLPDAKTARLVEWNAEVLLRLLKQIEASRQGKKKEASARQRPSLFKMSWSNRKLDLLEGATTDDDDASKCSLKSQDHASAAYGFAGNGNGRKRPSFFGGRKSKLLVISPGNDEDVFMDEISGSTGSFAGDDILDRPTTLLDEVKDVIPLDRNVDGHDSSSNYQASGSGITLSPTVAVQLHNYCSVIATMYKSVPFHSFDHASHVTMSITKLFSRMKSSTPKDQDESGADHTYGLTTDPLIQFACMFSALIHDVDHPGVPNVQLVREQAPLAALYKKSQAEQNSLDLAWKLLMDEHYEDLRKAIYSNEAEKKRFRAILVNSVMATDLLDNDLRRMREHRWEMAFGSTNDDGSKKQDSVNRKATVVVEHLVQASDVAHCMQHWNIYRKWNERFYEECHAAYQQGRADKNPSKYWYEGELDFFDNIVLPLVNKLKDSGVFGGSGNEFLQYAKKNRIEWKLRGKSIVKEMKDKYDRQSLMIELQQLSGISEKAEFNKVSLLEELQLLRGKEIVTKRKTDYDEDQDHENADSDQ